MSTDNARLYSSRIIYAPILQFEKYCKGLMAKYPEDKQRVISHLNAVKNQQITQALFIPKGGKLTYDGLVFFDRSVNIPLDHEVVKEMCNKKLFTLSDFGFYLFLLKLSIHFTRVQEKIDRSTGEDRGK